MKSKKWLFIAIAILLIINGIYYLLTNIIGIDNFIKDRLEASLSSRTDSKVSLERIDYNDKKVTIFGIHSENKNYSLKIESVTLEYNLLFLPFYKVLPRRTFSKILFYHPSFVLKKGVNFQGNNLGKLDFEKVLSSLPNFSVVEGNCSFEIEKEDKFLLKDKFDVFSCSFAMDENNKATSEVYIASDSRKLNCNLAFTNNEIDSINLQIDSFSLPNLTLHGLDSLRFVLDGRLVGSKSKFSSDLRLRDFSAKGKHFNLSLPKLELLGNEEYLNFNLHDGKLFGIPFGFETAFSHFLQSDVEMFGSITVSDRLKIEQFSAKRTKKKNKEVWDITNVLCLENEFCGSLVYGTDGVSFELQDTSFTLKKDDFYLNSPLGIFASWSSSSGFKANFSGDSLVVSSKNFIFDEAKLSGTLVKDTFGVLFTKRDSLIRVEFAGSFFSDSCSVSLETQQFNPNLLLKNKMKNLPMCRVSSEGELRNKILNSKIDIFLDDPYYGLVSGSFGSDFSYDFSQGQLSAGLRSYKATFNYNLFDLDMSLAGSFDSLNISNLLINARVRGNFLLRSDKKYAFSGSFVADSLELAKWQKYFSKQFLSEELGGILNAKFVLNEKGKVNFDLQTEGFRYGNWQGFDSKVSLEGKVDSLLVKEAFVVSGADTVVKATGDFLVDSLMTVSGIFDINNLNLANLQSNNKIWNGIISGKVVMNDLGQLPTFVGSLHCSDFAYKNIKFTDVNLRLRQEKKSLIFEKGACIFESKKEKLELQGELGYNLLNGSVYPSDKILQLYFQGDFLNVLAQFVPGMKSTSSDSRLALNMRMSDEGFKIEEGIFALKNGKVVMSGQKEKLKNVEAEMRIVNDSLFVEKIQGKIGDGKLNISNGFPNPKTELIIGNLNLGTVYFWTSDGEVTWHYPDYMDDDAVGSVEITGIDSPKGFVQGPADDMLISFELRASDWQGMFPKKSKNLLKLIQGTFEMSKHKDGKDFPFSMDLLLTIGDNAYYKTYPMDFLVEPGGYLRFHYEKDEKWELTDGNLSSVSGDMELFSGVFSVKTVKLKLSQSNSFFDLSGTFEATAIDGNTVSLKVKVIDRNVFSLIDNLEYELSSSDRNLTSELQIISSLSYDLSEEESGLSGKTSPVVGAQAMELLGGAVQSQVLDPFISPVENRLQRFLRLDLFRIKFNIVQNLLEDYDEQQSLTSSEENSSSRNVLLNKMKVMFGKSLTNRLFFVSEINLEEPDDPLMEEKDLLLNQKIGFKYIFPHNFRFQYDYNFSEDAENNSYEINLKKSIDF